MTDKPTREISGWVVLGNAVNRWVGDWRYAAGAIAIAALALLLAIHTGIAPPVDPEPTPETEQSGHPEKVWRGKISRPAPAKNDAAPKPPDAPPEQAPAAEKIAPIDAPVTLKPESPIAEQCLEMTDGRLCLTAREKEQGKVLARWQWQGAAEGPSRTMLEETLKGSPANVKLSSDERWLAHHLVSAHNKRLLVRSVPGLLGRADSTTHHLGMLSPVAAYRWEERLLHIEYREPAGDDKPDAVTTQRFDPESGRFVR